MATSFWDRERNTRVIDNTRPQAAPNDTNLSTGYATGDLLAHAADAWIATRTRNTWRLIYIIWGVIAVAGVVWYRDQDLDGWFTVGVCGLLAVAAYGLGWWNQEAVTHEAWRLFQERYQGVTAKITEPPQAPRGPVVQVEGDKEHDLQRLKAELRYVLIRAVHTPRSLRDNDYEVIPGVNVRLDKELYRFLMYILRELKLVTGGTDPRTGKRKKWVCNFATEAEALAAFERVAHKVDILNLDRIADQADKGDWDE